MKETTETQSHRDLELPLNEISSKIIGAAIEVHRLLGPGLVEPIYDRALCIEFDARDIRYARQHRVSARYKGRTLGNYYIDFVVADRVVVEIKSVSAITTVFEAQLLNYMRLANKRLGLLINFNVAVLKNGITRRVL